MLYISHSLEETRKIAYDFLALIKSKSLAPVVVCMSGNLGSGKTTFTQIFGDILEIKEIITSPTFVIQKRYNIDCPDFKFKNLIHIDAYRLSSGAELNTLGFQEELKNPENLILIEWPERVEDVLPVDTVDLKFEFIDESTRSINLIENE